MWNINCQIIREQRWKFDYNNLEGRKIEEVTDWEKDREREIGTQQDKSGSRDK